MEVAPMAGALVEGKLDPVVGRQDQIERVTQILGRRTKNNPCLIGEPGVGKTAIAEGLAQRIANWDVPETIEGKKSVGSMDEDDDSPASGSGRHKKKLRLIMGLHDGSAKVQTGISLNTLGSLGYEIDHGWRQRIAVCHSKLGDQPKRSHG
ncbi:Double Clp-N motif-containing P-loop nucleoside triphosphate hydrolase superfamily protein [Zea mays]|uniref:Double Clp-N motif-containing P-loop nucleoside triphosphate hydrolase superfamily protein n=1 Tax=Zea mays TaxID=4577 RepID=A0A1D6MJX7_MAIZE|nr:Double Clp-N motif-containing P-loop nucleoside triphosphate hydrolase superfamily protein [Zea mays]